ncbi:MAG TPA: hypothetical protein VFU82_08780 [Gammaproteobacteria bacterium]|nr:hypothetical protein [Gammaproteobacteria bacterium]
MGVSRTPAQTEADKQKEEQRRIDDQSKWSNAQQSFANFYRADKNISRLYWERVEGGGDYGLTSEAEKAENAALAITNPQTSIGQPNDSTFRLTDGLFRAVSSEYRSRETNRNIFIELKDGSARRRPPLLESEFASHQSLFMKKFNESYGQIMDFMAVQCGYSTMVVDLPDMSPVISQYDYMRLNALLRLAEERGLKLEYGTRVMEVLRDRPNDYARYMNMQKEVNEKSDAKMNTKMDKLHAYDYGFAAKDLSELNRPSQENYKEEINKNIKGENLAQLDAFEGMLKAAEGRAGRLEASLNALNEHIGKYEKQIEGAEDAAGLAVVERYLAAAEERRAQLIEAMKKERDALQMMHGELNTKYADIKTLVIDKAADGSALKPEQITAQEKRRDGMDDGLKKLDERLKDKLSDAKLKEVKEDKLQSLKEKLAEKKNGFAAKPVAP